MKSVILSLLFLEVCCVSCSSSLVLPDYSKIDAELSNEIVTENFIYHLSPADSINQLRNEKYIAWLKAKMKIRETAKIHYYKYLDVNQKSKLMGSKGNAVVLDRRIHTIWPFDNHEIVHVLMDNHIGSPPKLFTEGVAVSHQTNPLENDFIPRWGGNSIDSIALNYKSDSKIPPIDSLLVMSQFFKYSENITYPVSGSFVKYLIDTYGYDHFFKFASECNWDRKLSEIKEIFIEFYGTSLDEVWKNWLENLSNNM